MMAIMTRLRPGAAAVVCALGFVALTGCSSDSEASNGRVFQARPVLAQQPVGAGVACPPIDVNPPTTEPVSTCSTDQAVLYSLGPAFATNGSIAAATSHSSDFGGAKPDAGSVTVALAGEGNTELTSVTETIKVLPPPQNQIATVINGVVVSAVTVQERIIDGRIEVTGLSSAAEAQALAYDLAQ
jgi:preprotein translocase subunit SecD